MKLKLLVLVGLAVAAQAAPVSPDEAFVDSAAAKPVRAPRQVIPVSSSTDTPASSAATAEEGTPGVNRPVPQRPVVVAPASIDPKPKPETTPPPPPPPPPPSGPPSTAPGPLSNPQPPAVVGAVSNGGSDETSQGSDSGWTQAGIQALASRPGSAAQNAGPLSAGNPPLVTSPFVGSGAGGTPNPFGPGSVSPFTGQPGVAQGPGASQLQGGVGLNIAPGGNSAQNDPDALWSQLTGTVVQTGLGQQAGVPGVGQVPPGVQSPFNTGTTFTGTSPFVGSSPFVNTNPGFGVSGGNGFQNPFNTGSPVFNNAGTIGGVPGVVGGVPGVAQPGNSNQGLGTQ